jgi:hypothetical protein
MDKVQKPIDSERNAPTENTKFDGRKLQNALKDCWEAEGKE